jgi:hypothetical protein
MGRASSTFGARLAGALRLDPAAFEAAEADPQANLQAAAVVVAFAAAAGLALAGPDSPALSLAVAIAGALAAWLSWATLVCYLGLRVFAEPQTRADVGQLARTVGFSAAPGVFLALLAIPQPRPVRLALFAAVCLWMLAAMVVAVRQALDFRHTGRAIASPPGR